MEISSKHLIVSSSCFFVYLGVVILLSCFNLQGLDFLVSATPVISGNDTDQQALLQFKAKISGDQLGVLHSWNSTIHFCRWYGVTCSRRRQRVTKQYLRSLKLVGTLSPHIGNLSFLRVLNLQNNSFNNAIPQEIGRLHRLQELRLDNNSFGGKLPLNISSCFKLEAFSVSDNELLGEIPSVLGSLSNMKELRLVGNKFTGTIPPSLGNLSALFGITLATNHLTGHIPEALGQLTKLTIFSLGQNGISGIIPASIFNLSNIRQLEFGYNQFEGCLPSNLGITMPHIEYLSFSRNQFIGSIPASISNASNLSLFQISQNKLSGNLFSFQKLGKLARLIIYDNHLGSGGANDDLNFLCSLSNSSALSFLDIGENNFGGLLPECISNLSRSLVRLVMDENKIFGRIPAGIENLVNLEVLVAINNRLSGSIPYGIGRLRKLKVFYADYNSLSGAIPTSFGNLTMLIYLNLRQNNLQGKIPSDLARCENLIELRLSNNNLTGSIPAGIIGLSSLSIILDLSSNSLSGMLPIEVENQKNLGVLNVSFNTLSGVLPNTLGSCVRLEKLYLSGNFFHGFIPSLSSLKGLIELDISDNNFSGEIPNFLVSLKSLRYLNLSFNDFEGPMPNEGVFKNASAIFFEGNNKLCGGNPEFHLPICNLKGSIRKSKNSLKLKLAIVFGVSGATLVFSVFLLFWFKKKKTQPIPTSERFSHLKLSYQSIVKATDGFSSANLVGAGGFGSVYKGILEENGVAIAVKVLNLSSQGASRSFMAECEVLKNVRHRNLVKVLTACSGVDYQCNDFKALVYEFMVNGSLEDWLHPFVGTNEQEIVKILNLFQRVNVALDVANALEYLHHHCKPLIIHCDLKPSNILLDDEMVGHVSDFGLAKFLSADNPNHSVNQSSSLGLRGTIGYSPPEYAMGSKVSIKGDVYSYGILLLEMFTGKRPTDEMFKEGLSLHNYVKAALPKRVVDIIDPILLQDERYGQGTTLNSSRIENSQRNDQHLQYVYSVLEMGVACSAETPSERMEMSDVVVKLCSIRDKLHPTRLQRNRQT